MKKILEVNHLSKMYGQRQNKVHVLNNISFTVSKGEFVGIMGPSGAGKSTLLNTLSTIDFPTTGSVRIDERDILKMKTNEISDFRRKKLGFIFQEYNLIDHLTVKDNIVLPLSVDHLPINQIDQRLQQVTENLGIHALLDRYPTDISVGQKQRVAAGRALITKPSIIFADEPTGSLDSKAATELLTYMTTINGTEKATIIMVTHDPFTASYCHRILFIKDGVIFSEVVRHGSRKDFFNRVIDMQATIGGGGRANAF